MIRVLFQHTSLETHPVLIKCTQDDFLIEQEIEHTFRAE